MSRTETNPHPVATVEAPDLPEVTVLMPTYNGARFLEEQIESILGQDYKRLRLTVVDDGSQDRSYDLAKEIAARDSRVTVSRNPQNVGLIATIGRLLGSVETPYFALADQDDIWDGKKLSRSLRALRSANTSLVYSDVRVCNANGAVIDQSYLSSRRIRPVTGRDPVPFVFRNPAIGHTIVATKPVADIACDIPTNLVFHEAWIVAAACKVGAVGFVDEQLGRYRVHAANVVGPKRAAVSRRMLALASGQGRLARRQHTRATALTAVARLHPELRPIADLLQRRGNARLRGAPRYFTFMARYVPTIGLGAVLVEAMLFTVQGLVPTRLEDRGPMKAAETGTHGARPSSRRTGS